MPRLNQLSSKVDIHSFHCWPCAYLWYANTRNLSCLSLISTTRSAT
jgi:hypothetical protein